MLFQYQSMSCRVAVVLSLAFRLYMILSRNLTSWIVMLWLGRNPNCSGLICFIIWVFNLKRSFLKSFPIVLSREIGRWLIEIFRSFFGFGIIIMSTIFYFLGKNSSLAHKLYILHRIIASFPPTTYQGTVWS